MVPTVSDSCSHEKIIGKGKLAMNRKVQLTPRIEKDGWRLLWEISCKNQYFAPCLLSNMLSLLGNRSFWVSIRVPFANEKCSRNPFAEAIFVGVW